MSTTVVTASTAALAAPVIRCPAGSLPGAAVHRNASAMARLVTAVACGGFARALMNSCRLRNAPGLRQRPDAGGPRHPATLRGAGGGMSSEASARSTAALLHDTALCRGFGQRGVAIPADIWFIGLLHDTCFDAVGPFDIDRLLASLAEALAELRAVGGAIGVLEGNAGDLRVGLPMQSLHDGKQWRHEPTRLSVLLAAPRAAIDDVIARHDLVGRWWTTGGGISCVVTATAAHTSACRAAGGGRPAPRVYARGLQATRAPTTVRKKSP